MAGGHKQAVSPAVKFLCGLFSVEPRKVQLVAIQKGKGPVDTRLVHPETEAPLIDKFLDEHNSTRARRHCYFSINEVTTPNKKAKASEIGHVRAFHVDIDCGEDKEAQKRALDRLMKDRPAGVPEPTAIVFSGGGFWAFWALKDPIAVNGDEALLENLTDVNRRLAEVFEAEGGDSCFDISRIARLPGSINYASDKGGGRTNRKATVLHDDWGTGQKPRRYALNDFLKLPAGEGRSAVGKRSGPGRGAGAASAGGGRSCPPPVPAVSWTDLGYQIGDDGEPTNPDDLSAVIASGPDARDLSERELRERWKKPSGKWDRSLAVYYVCCELDRRGVKPDVIAAVILDRTFGISDHLYDHVKGEGERPSFSRAMYARRQVERAMADNDAVMAEKIAAPEPPFLYAEALPWLNARYATIENFGGKYRVMARPGVDDPVEPKFQDKTQWAFRFDGQMVGVPDPETGDLKSVPLAKAWLNDRRRSRFNRVEFDPEGAPDPNVLNLWQGFHLPNKATDCEEYIALTRDVIAAGDPVVFDYLMKWMALRVQRPGLKLEVALALQGGQGLGKSLWVELFGDLFGAHFVAVSGKHGIASNFNAHLQRCLLLLGDEMNAGSDRQMVARLKTMGTQTHIMIEPKGVDSFSAPNRFAMIVCSNDAKVIDIDPDDRRWLAIEVSAAWKGDLERFARLVEHWRDGGGREAFYEHLMGVDLSEFNHRRRPITKTHTEQVEHSLKGAARVVQAMLARGETPPVMRDGVEKFCPYRNSGEVFVPTSDAIDWGRRKGLLNRLDENLETAMGRELAKASALKGAIRKSVYGRQIRGVWLAPLKEARERWNRESGLDLEWDEDGGAWDVIPVGAAGGRGDGSIDEDGEPEVPF